LLAPLLEASIGSTDFGTVFGVSHYTGMELATPLTQVIGGAFPMAIQIVMDHSGDSRNLFDPKDRASLAKAEDRFRELMDAGFTAAARTTGSNPIIIRRFDPAIEETLFFSRLVAG
jgi:hypothetical protein